jgi:outer membrane protein assembly factor BamB
VPGGTGEIALANNVAYMACDGEWLCAVNATTGALIWRSGTCAFEGCTAPFGPFDSLTVAGGIVYVRANGGFGLVNAATGLIINGDEFWQAPGTQAPVVNNGRVYVVTENRIHIFGLCSPSGGFTSC